MCHHLLPNCSIINNSITIKNVCNWRSMSMRLTIMMKLWIVFVGESRYFSICHQSRAVKQIVCFCSRVWIARICLAVRSFRGGNCGGVRRSVLLVGVFDLNKIVSLAASLLLLYPLKGRCVSFIFGLIRGHWRSRVRKI